MATATKSTPEKKQPLYKHLKSVPKKIAEANQKNLDTVRKALFGEKERGYQFPVQQVSGATSLAALQKMQTDANVVLCSANRKKFLPWVEKKISALTDDSAESVEARKKATEMLTAARNGDKDQWNMLAELVRVNTGYLLMGSALWAQFFDIRQLTHNDIVYLHNEVPREIKVDIIGEDGRADTVQPQRQKSVAFVPMVRLASDIFETLCVDLYHGYDAKDAALASVDIARDLAAKIDSLIQAYILAGSTDSRIVASFNVGVGVAPEDADYVTHSRVNVANLPAGNLLTLSDNTATSSFRLDVIKAVRKYLAAWGSGAFGEQFKNLKIEAIHVPSKDATDLDDSFQATTDGNKLNDQFVDSDFTSIHYNGDDIAIIADNTLDPAQGICYVRTNMPVGLLYEKPELSQSLHITGKDDANLLMNNKEQFQEVKVLGFAMPKTWRVGVVAVKYRT